MYGYIRQGRRTALTRETIGGVPFWVLTAGQGRLRRRGVRRLLRRMARCGVKTAVFEDDAWQAAAAKYGIRPPPVQALRLCKLGELLDCICPRGLRGQAVRLHTGGGRRGGPARRAGAGPAGAVRGAGALRPDGTGAMAAGAVRSGGRVLRPYAGGDGASGARTGEAGRGSVLGTGLRRAPAGDLRGAGAGTVAGDGAAAGGADRSGAMGAIRNSCGFGDFPRLTGGGKLTIMQRDILCVFCL